MEVARGVKFGHAGTLDPMAVGVLLVAVGSATRLVELLHELPKSYSAQFEFGKRSPTLDSDSEEIEVVDGPVPTLQSIEEAASYWIGEVEQIPPQVSALKVGGKRAYDLVRRGEEVPLAARPVRIDRISVTLYEYPFLNLDMDCGSGTYVRSLGRDLAAALHTFAIMTKLTRTAVGPFSIASAISMDQLTGREEIEKHLRSPLDGLVGAGRVQLDAEQLQLVMNGRTLDGARLSVILPDEGNANTALAKVVAAQAPDGRLAAVMEIDAAGHLKPKRVFQAAAAINQPTAIKSKQSPESS
ncbi:MAG: tRNA pseudouridine(55) synthase TruB [Pirellulales bacterium]